MVEARAEIVIDRPADEVWARIRDFADVSWIPNTASVRMDGDVRRVTMEGLSVEVAQRLVSHDDEARTFSYEMAERLEPAPGFVVEFLEAVVEVTPIDDSSTRVTYDVDTHDFMVAAVNAEYQGALDKLKGMLEV